MVSIPLETLALAGGGELDDVRAFTSLGTYVLSASLTSSTPPRLK